MADPHEDDGESADRPPQQAAADPVADDGDTLRERTPGDASADRDVDRGTAPGAGGTSDTGTPAASDTRDQSVVEAVGDPGIEAVLGERRTLHGRVRVLWLVRRVIPAVVLGAIAGFVALQFGFVASASGAAGVAAAIAGVVFVLGALHAVLLYRSWHYVVRENSLYLTRGVFTVVQTVVPYVRVQHIDTRRSALERALGLSSLVVYTAGSRGADVTIPGLTPDRAETLQSRLKRLAIESEDEDAV